MSFADKLAGIVTIAIVFLIVFGLGQNTVAIIQAIGGSMASFTQAATGGIQLTQQQASYSPFG